VGCVCVCVRGRRSGEEKGGRGGERVVVVEEEVRSEEWKKGDID